MSNSNKKAEWCEYESALYYELYKLGWLIINAVSDRGHIFVKMVKP